MSQSVETPASTRTVLNGSGKDGKGRASAMLFNELVLAHFRWFTLHGRYGELGGLPAELAPPGWRSGHSKQSPEEEQRKEKDPDLKAAEDRKEAEDLYHSMLEQFTDTEGEIVAAYWAATVPSGIVMTMKPRSRVRNLLRGPDIALHRATTWLTASDPSVAELLHHCDTLGNKAGQILTRTPKRVAMTWIFSTESYLLGIVEGRLWGPLHGRSEHNGRREWKAARVDGTSTTETPQASADKPTEATGNSTKRATDETETSGNWVTEPTPELTAADLVTRGRSEIIEIEKYYDRAASNAARFLYFWGMLAGALVATAIGVLTAVTVGVGFDVIDLGSPSTRFFFACYAAGALGAIVSVLTRMRRDDFSLDYEVGRMPAFVLGAFRPFLGAVFGLFIYFALESELLQLQQPVEEKAFFFFTLLAFVAGFSERLTHVIIGGAEKTVAGTLEQADNAVGEIKETTRTADGTTITTTRKSLGTPS